MAGGGWGISWLGLGLNFFQDGQYPFEEVIDHPGEDEPEDGQTQRQAAKDADGNNAANAASAGGNVCGGGQAEVNDENAQANDYHNANEPRGNDEPAGFGPRLLAPGAGPEAGAP